MKTMGLSRWLEAAGIDPKMFRRVAAARYGRGRNFGEPPEPGQTTGSSPAAGGREDTRAATLDPVVETGERSEFGPDRRGDTDPASGSSGGLWEARDANGEHMPSALSSMLKSKPGRSFPNEASAAPRSGFLLSMMGREHQTGSG